MMAVRQQIYIAVERIRFEKHRHQRLEKPLIYKCLQCFLEHFEVRIAFLSAAEIKVSLC